MAGNKDLHPERHIQWRHGNFGQTLGNLPNNSDSFIGQAQARNNENGNNNGKSRPNLNQDVCHFYPNPNPDQKWLQPAANPEKKDKRTYTNRCSNEMDMADIVPE